MMGTGTSSGRILYVIATLLDIKPRGSFETSTVKYVP